MFPRWVRDQIAEAWHNRKSSRNAGRQSSTLSGSGSNNSEISNVIHMPIAAAPGTFSINVISLEGNVLAVVVKPEFTIGTIKVYAVKYFYGQDLSKAALEFRLIHSSKFKRLIDEHTLEDEDIRDCDELLLVEIRRRPPGPPPSQESEEALKGPTVQAVERATINLPVYKPPPSPPPAPAEHQQDFMNEIRKIMITLVQVSAMILLHSPEAQKYYDILKDKLEDRKKPIADPKSVKHLVDMGFPRHRAIRALQLRKSNMTRALEWLIEHQDDESDSEDDSSSAETGNKNDATVPGPSSSTKKEKKSSAQTTKESVAEGNLVTIVDQLLKSYGGRKKMDYKRNPDAIQSLFEMGLEGYSTIIGGEITGNYQANARETPPRERKRTLEDANKEIEQDKLMYEAILNDPRIQLSLMNPNMLLAFLSMLETPMTTDAWLNDPEVSAVLGQIFKTCKRRKFIMNTNRRLRVN